MPAPYSKDLRQKVIAAVERGERKSDVSRMLNIRWMPKPGSRPPDSATKPCVRR